MNLKKITKIKCMQLNNDYALSGENYNIIAELIYDTDPYIYPAMFGDGEEGKEIAVSVLADLYKTDRDSMFCLKNLFIALIEDRIVGIILWYKGILNWKYGELLKSSKKQNISLDKGNLEIVQEKYFSENYSEDTSIDQAISIINVCVDRNYRGLGIGKIMLNSFINSHKGEEIKLCVIADNENAVKLYRNKGFTIEKEFDGFSLCEKKPRCYDMVLKK